MSFSNIQETGRPVTIRDEGVSLTTNVASLDFTGSGVSGSAIGTSVTETIPGGSGDLVGPVSATDNAVTRFDTTTGKLVQSSIISIGDTGILAPITTDTGALGSTAYQWSDLFLAEGGVINWDNGDATLTQVGDVLTLAGAVFSADLGSSTATTQVPNNNSTKIATTAYVDEAVVAQNYKEAVKYASVAPLPSIVYSNGSSGLGRTLTGVALAAISLDGSSPAVGNRVLIKNQASDFQNGIYTVTQTGSGIAVFILTGATDADQSNEYETGDAVFVTSGSTLSATTWAYTGIDSPTMGATSLTFVQIAGQGSFTGGNGITITGTSIAINTAVTVDLSTAQSLTNKNLSGAGNTFPTFNQDTTGSAAKWTTARLLAGNSIDGSANVAFANKFIVQGTADTGLSAAQFLGALGTGIVKNTTTTGVLSIAINTDLPVGDATHAGAVPTPPNDTTKFLRGDMTFAVPTAAATQTPGLEADVNSDWQPIAGTPALDTFDLDVNSDLQPTALSYDDIGGEITVEGTDQNEYIESPNYISLLGENGNTFTDVAMNNKWTRILACFGTTSQRIYVNRTGNPFNCPIRIATKTTVITGNYCCFHALDNKFYIANTVATVAQCSNDDTLSGETNVSFSGGSPTAIKGIASDGTNLWILDKVGSTHSLLKYSVSGTTLTLVSTTALSNSSPVYANLAYQDANHIYSRAASTNIYMLNTSGQVVFDEAITNISGTDLQGIFMDPDNNLRILQIFNGAAVILARFALP